MRINGWHRLWIMSAAIWLGVVSIAAWHLRPRAESIPHREEFLEAVHPKSAIYQCPSPATQQDCEKLAKAVIEMPNGYHFMLSVYDDKDAPSAAKSYWKTVEDEAWVQQRQAAFLAFAIWLVSSMIVLLIGHGVAWVWRGFKQSL